MRRIVAPGKLLVVRQFFLHLVKYLLTDDRRDIGYRDPVLGWHGRSAVPLLPHRCIAE